MPSKLIYAAEADSQRRNGGVEAHSKCNIAFQIRKTRAALSSRVSRTGSESARGCQRRIRTGMG